MPETRLRYMPALDGLRAAVLRTIRLAIAAPARVVVGDRGEPPTLQIANAGVLGCGVIRGDAYIGGTWYPNAAKCDHWSDSWPELIQSQQYYQPPDLASRVDRYQSLFERPRGRPLERPAPLGRAGASGRHDDRGSARLSRPQR